MAVGGNQCDGGIRRGNASSNRVGQDPKYQSWKQRSQLAHSGQPMLKPVIL